MGYDNSRDNELKLVEEKKEDDGGKRGEELRDRNDQEKVRPPATTATATTASASASAGGSAPSPETEDPNPNPEDQVADGPSDMQQDLEVQVQSQLQPPDLPQQAQSQQLQQQHDSQSVLSFGSSDEGAAMQQLHQANMAAQQLLEHAVAAQQTQLMTSSLSSLQLGAPAQHPVLPPASFGNLAGMGMGMAPPLRGVPPVPLPVPVPVGSMPGILGAPQPPAATQIQQQVLAQQQAAAQAAALTIGAVTSSQTAMPASAGVPPAGMFPPAGPIAPGLVPPPFSGAPNQVHHQQGAGPLGLDPLSAAPLLAAADPLTAAPLLAVADPITAAPLLAATGLAGANPVAALSPTNVAAGAIVPSVPNPAAVASAVVPTTTHHLSPQMTIPHYVPPIPPTWGAQTPALSVQDRPLVPPIYNGINPNYPGAQLLHAHPPIFVVENFLSPAECDFLVAAAHDAFGPAPVVGRGSGEVSPSRTSSTCYLAREDLPEYLRKVSLLTGKPAEHCELPQVGRYLPSQRYLQHFDAFDLSNEDGRRFAANGGQRTVTVLVYLNDVPRGGATAFPNLNVEVRPRRGMALVFFPSTLDGLLDKMALHAALPAVDIKYVSQVWIRQGNYEGRPSKRLAEPMVAGLQERRDAVGRAALIGQLQTQQQLQQHQAAQQHHAAQQQLLQQQGYQQMS